MRRHDLDALIYMQLRRGPAINRKIPLPRRPVSMTGAFIFCLVLFAFVVVYGFIVSPH